MCQGSRHFPLTNLFNIHTHPIRWLLLLSYLKDQETGPEMLNNLPQTTPLIDGKMRQSSRMNKALTTDNCNHLLNASYVPEALHLFFPL